MAIEQYDESIVLREMKRAFGENGFGSCFPQRNIAHIGKLENALKKARGKPSVRVLAGYSQGGNGKAKPEYIITFNRQSKTIIAVGCKKSAAKHRLEKPDRPKDYAVDDALYYANFLKERL